MEAAKLRVYVCGPMTGLPGFNRPAFFEAAAQLVAAGYAVVNPAELPPDQAWEWYMDKAMLQVPRCDGIALLPGWLLSRGACMELHKALENRLFYGPVCVWLRQSGYRNGPCQVHE